jgi:hypothetical protein
MEFLKIFVIIILVVHHAAPQPSPFGFKNQFIGHTRYVTPEEEENRNFCNNYWCTNDAHYLFTKSSQYPNVDPCVDFKNFTVNQVDEVDVPDDREQYRGFLTIGYNKMKERLRKVAAAKFDPIKDHNSRTIKVIKNTFQQCIKTPHVLRHIQAHQDILNHLQVLGGSPYLSKHLHFNPDKFNETSDYGRWAIWTNNVPNDFTDEDKLWSGSSFNISKYFEHEPFIALNIFFNLEVGRCDGEVCLKQSSKTITKIKDDRKIYLFEQFKEALRTLDDAFIMRPQMRQILADQVYRPAVERLLKITFHLQDVLKGSDQSFRIRVRDMRDKLTPELQIDWMKVINSELFKESRLSEDDEIMVEGAIMEIQGLAKWLLETDKK